MITAIVTTVGGLIGSWLTNRKEKAQARHERDVAIIKGKQRLAEGEQSHNSSWELEALKRASKPLRWGCAATAFTPVWITMFKPEQGKAIFNAMRDTVPNEWWVLIIVVFMFAFASKNLVELVKNFKLFK